ncbi:MAG: MnhB domain-containing protein [Actinomycetota bacterium]|nr:MAG: multicomponent Na+H+ antiporter subunit [Actinomycetota bacterium]MDO8949220.1 MnhB domain-containing protein [Actinomycetota bacterium]MDP3631451.1 MnhB domain-containing protein [Actinomycetota bacterium]
MKRALTVALLVVVAIPLLYAVAQLPQHGSPMTPPYTHISPRYLEKGPEEAGAENIVTDVILNYRGFDTNGEVTVIFTSLAAVCAVLLGSRKGDERPAGEPSSSAVPVSDVVSFVVRLLSPLIAIFAVYVMLFGHISPGGGFQSGAILAALVIVTTVIVGRKQAEALVPVRIRRLLQVAAPLTFFVVGVSGLFLFGDYLAYPKTEGQMWLATAWLIVIGIGIGVGGAAVLASIFWTMGDDS